MTTKRALRAAAAERQRRARARRKAVAMVVAVTVDIEVTEALIAAGRLAPNCDGDREKIARAIELFLANPVRPVTRDAMPIRERVDSSHDRQNLRKEVTAPPGRSAVARRTGR